MKHYKSINRTESLYRLAPDLYKYDSVLYIGARPDRYDYMDVFARLQYKVTVIEPFAENYLWLRTLPWIDEVIRMEVQELIFWEEKYDVVFWWHGPEHVEEDELHGIVKELEKTANKMVVMGCPWGKVPQGAIFHNPYEKHLWDVTPEHFDGYDVECLGMVNKSGSNITAVKYI